MQNNRKRLRGFTVVELMITIAIISLIFGAIIFTALVFFGRKAAVAVDQHMESTQGPTVQRGATLAAAEYAHRIESEPNPIVECQDRASLVDRRVDCVMRLPSTGRVVSVRCPYLGTGTCLPVTHP